MRPRKITPDEKVSGLMQKCLDHQDTYVLIELYRPENGVKKIVGKLVCTIKTRIYITLLAVDTLANNKAIYLRGVKKIDFLQNKEVAEKEERLLTGKSLL